MGYGTGLHEVMEMAEDKESCSFSSYHSNGIFMTSPDEHMVFVGTIQMKTINDYLANILRKTEEEKKKYGSRKI